MALLDSEVRRLKYELGYNVLSVGAEPYIGVAAVFEQVIQPYLTAGASTTSSTAVVAASPPAVVSVTLASATGFAAGARVIVDVDDAQEITTVRAISGSVMSVFLSKAHPAGYPVTVEGGESIVRAILRKLQDIAGFGEMGALSGALDVAGVKKVDEIEFFGGVGASDSSMRQVLRLREYWRDELAAALGIERLNGGGNAGSSIAVY